VAVVTGGGSVPLGIVLFLVGLVVAAGAVGPRFDLPLTL